jgi:hypothetical protein
MVNTAPLGDGTGNAGNAPSGAISVWFVVPEGELGDITNALSQIAGNLKLSADPLTDLDNLKNLVQDTSITPGIEAPSGSGAYTILHVTSATQEQTLEAAGADGPYASQAAAQAEANNKTQAGNTNSKPGWNLSVSGISGWFWRALKVVFGGILMIVGISKLTGADNAIMQVANKIPMVAAV